MVPEAQPVRTVQPPFDFHLCSTKPSTDFFPWHSPAVAVPAYGVIVGYLARHAHAQDFFQAVFAPQPPMRITGITRCHRKTLLPFRKKVPLQKVIGRGNAVDSRQTHFFHQAILQGSNSRSIRPLACGLCAAIHSIPRSCSARPNCERAPSPCSCSPIAARRVVRNMLFLSV